MTAPKTNWKPLEQKIGRHWSQFIYMGRNGDIHLYKNLPTGIYLYLDDDGRCFSLQDTEFHLANFEEQWNHIAGKLGIDCGNQPSQRSVVPERLAMNSSVRLAMRIVAFTIPIKFIMEVFSPRSALFTRFSPWLAGIFVTLPLYFLWELNWQRRGNLDKGPLGIGVALAALIAPMFVAVTIILWLFVGNWIPVLRILFR